jgi:hypothetical protein
VRCYCITKDVVVSLSTKRIKSWLRLYRSSRPPLHPVATLAEEQLSSTIGIERVRRDLDPLSETPFIPEAGRSTARRFSSKFVTSRLSQCSQMAVTCIHQPNSDVVRETSGFSRKASCLNGKRTIWRGIGRQKDDGVGMHDLVHCMFTSRSLDRLSTSAE